MNLWIKRAIGAAALGGGLLAATAGAAGAQEVSADASATPRSRAATADADAGADTSPRADADAAARARRLVDLGATASLAGVGLLGSSPFTLVGDPAGEPLLAIGDLTLADVADQAPAGIGVLDAGPIASGNQATVDVGDVSPSVPVTVCGNGVGALGDASAACGTAQPSAAAARPRPRPAGRTTTPR